MGGCFLDNIGEVKGLSPGFHGCPGGHLSPYCHCLCLLDFQLLWAVGLKRLQARQHRLEGLVRQNAGPRPRVFD